MKKVSRYSSMAFSQIREALRFRSQEKQAIAESLRIYEFLRAANGGTDEMTAAVVKPLILLYWPSVCDYLTEKDKSYAPEW